MTRKQISYDEVDYETHPSLSLALDEAHKRYQDAEDRRRTVETKIGIIVSINAIIISIVASLGGFHPWGLTAIILLALASAGVGMYVLWPEAYERPGSDIEHIFGDAQMKPYEFEKQLVNDYREATSSNQQKNDDRYLFFKVCAVLTALSILLIPLSQLG